MVAESGGTISRFILFGFYLVLDKIVQFPLSSFPSLQSQLNLPLFLWSFFRQSHWYESSEWQTTCSDGVVGLLRPLFRKALKLGLTPGPTQSYLLKGFAELKPEHGRIKSRVQLSFVVVANRDSVRAGGTRPGEGRAQAGRVATGPLWGSGPAQGSPSAAACWERTLIPCASS